MTAAPTKPPTLVLGLGNVLLGDEGGGVHIIALLDEGFTLPPEVELLDGGTSGMDLLEAVAGRDRLIIADATTADAPPGTVCRLADAELQVWLRQRLSPHQFGLADLLAVLALSGEAPRQVVLYGVVPEAMDLNLSLSATVAPAARRVAAQIAAEVGAVGRAQTRSGCPDRPWRADAVIGVL